MKEIFVEKKLPFGWTLCKYWPAEIILKHPARKHGIYIKAPWCPWQDRTRWEGADGKFYAKDCVSPVNERGYRTLTLNSWGFARRYVRAFTYVGRYGHVQNAVLTARRSRTRTVWYCLRWLPFAGTDHDGLEIEFSEEMGNERGSWKGGCIGTSVSIRKGETVERAINRFLKDAQDTYRWDR